MNIKGERSRDIWGRSRSRWLWWRWGGSQGINNLLINHAFGNGLLKYPFMSQANHYVRAEVLDLLGSKGKGGVERVLPFTQKPDECNRIDPTVSGIPLLRNYM